MVDFTTEAGHRAQKLFMDGCCVCSCAAKFSFALPMRRVQNIIVKNPTIFLLTSPLSFLVQFTTKILVTPKYMVYMSQQ